MRGGKHIAGGFANARALLRYAFLLLALCVVPLDADAKSKAKPDPKPDLSMQFAIVRGSTPLCEPNCPEWIWAEGEIKSDTAIRFKKFLKTVGNRKLPVIIQSPGGHVDAALAMGRMIRAKKLDVAVGYTTFSSCAPRQKVCDVKKTGGYKGIAAVGFSYCNSACPFVLAGGTKRLVGSWAHLGVHQITTTMIKEKIFYRTTTRVVNGKKVVSKKVVSRKKTGSYNTTKMSKSLRRKIETYLVEMGVSTDLLEPINKTPAEGMLRLDQSELLRLRLVTSLDQVDLLTRPSVCKASPVAPNCREVAAPEAPKAQDAVADTKPVDAKPSEARPSGAKSSEAKSGEAKVTELTASAAPKSSGEMTFVVVRGSSPLCNPNCPEWIAAEGTITRVTPLGLADLLKTVEGRRLPVVINSTGGDLLGALETGRMIRQHGLDTAVAKTHFIECQGEQEACIATDDVRIGSAVAEQGACGAACPLMFAGGVRRYVGPLADLRVQKLALETWVAQYLAEMEVAPRLLSYMRAHMWKAARLGPGLMQDFKVVTGPESVDHLTGPHVCKSSPQPSNCRVVAKGL